MSYPGFVWSRNNPPSDDLDPNDENELQWVGGGGGDGDSGTITFASVAVTVVTITNGVPSMAGVSRSASMMIMIPIIAVLEERQLSTVTDS